MSKYGLGISMKDFIETERDEVTAILDRNGVSGEDKQAVIDSLMEMAYQWCCANAIACFLSRRTPEEIPKMKPSVLLELMRKEMEQYGSLFDEETEEAEHGKL